MATNSHLSLTAKSVQNQSYIITNSLFWSQKSIWDLWSIFLFFKIIFRQLRVCSCWVPSLRIGWICRVQLLLGLASTVFLGSKSCQTYDFQPGGPGSSIYFPQEQGSPVIPQTLGLYNSYTCYYIICQILCTQCIYRASFSPCSVQQIMPYLSGLGHNV
jgi:hypothetical protein